MRRWTPFVTLFSHPKSSLCLLCVDGWNTVRVAWFMVPFVTFFSLLLPFRANSCVSWNKKDIEWLDWTGMERQERVCEVGGGRGVSAVTSCEEEETDIDCTWLCHACWGCGEFVYASLGTLAGCYQVRREEKVLAWVSRFGGLALACSSFSQRKVLYGLVW